MLSALVLIVAPLGALAPAASLEKEVPRLSDQVDASTFICIGTVDEVIAVPFPNGIEVGRNRLDSQRRTELRFARVRVERVLKGDPQTKVVFHEAWRTWACDDTRDTVGERSLFLLGPGAIAAARADDRARAASTLGSNLILRNVDSGDGIIPISRDGEQEYLVCSGCSYSILPTDAAKGWRLADVVTWIETSVRFSPENVAVHARCNRPIPRATTAAGALAEANTLAPDTFDLRILPDGRRRLARRLGMNETVVVDRIDPAVWLQLQNTLRAQIGNGDDSFGTTSGWTARTLAVRLDNHRLEFAQRWDQDLNDADDDQRLATRRALRAWAAIWDVLDCSSCSDYRAADARFLEAR